MDMARPAEANLRTRPAGFPETPPQLAASEDNHAFGRDCSIYEHYSMVGLNSKTMLHILDRT
jgi:hypothetical protein